MASRPSAGGMMSENDLASLRHIDTALRRGEVGGAGLVPRFPFIPQEPMPPPRKVPVTARALLMRVNRALAARQEALRRCRPSSPIRATLGAYYRLSLKQNTVLATHVDLEALARELGVLHPYEQLAPEE